MRMLKSLSSGVSALQARTKLSFPFALMLGLADMQSQGQGMLHISFDGSPLQPPGTAYTIQQYYESGMSFTPIDPNAPFAGFGRVGPGIDRYPENGTVHLKAAAAQSLMFNFINGVPFHLASVDLAEYSTVVPDAVTVRFIGYRIDGSIVNTDLTTDGIIDGTGPLVDFETFQFGPEWTGLSRVEIPTYGWSLDNLVVSIPEPGTWALLVLGGVVAGCRFWKRRRRR